MTAAHGPSAGAARPATMADVAARAGVSHQTVSRVLNAPATVAPATRERVESAMAELRYRPNTAARTLAGRRSGIIGLIAAQLSQFGPARTVDSIEASVRAAGYHLSLVGLPAFTPETFTEALDVLLRQSVDAVVVDLPHQAVLSLIRDLDVDRPIIVVKGDPAQLPLTSGIDQVLGARQATRHLLDLGHPTVVHIAGPQDWAEARDRVRGWRDELASAGRAGPPLRWAGDWSARSGYAAGEVLAREADLSAVFVANDQMALGVMSALRAAGRRVPEDVSVVGFDDTPEAAYFCPPLTTVRQDFDELGRRTTDLVLRAVAGEAEPSVALVPTALVVRASTAPPSG